jgi:hypothetical protein
MQADRKTLPPHYEHFIHFVQISHTLLSVNPINVQGVDRLRRHVHINLRSHPASLSLATHFHLMSRSTMH